MKDLRTLVVRLVVGSFSVAALLGIAALLGGAALDGTGGKVLLTTLVVGVESLAVLCYLAVGTGRWAWVGAVGGLVSLVPTAIALWLVWGSWDGDGALLLRTFGVGVTLALSLAQACLLLGSAEAARGRGRALLTVTSALVGLLAAMVVAAILTDGGLGGTFWRLLGVVAILDVLGTIVTIVTLRLTSRQDRAPVAEGGTAHDRLVAEARRRGTTPDALLGELLEGIGA
jgi:MFS family permease